jgi:2-keto-3-deoxy-6-phosphogluconate aldolase
MTNDEMLRHLLDRQPVLPIMTVRSEEAGIRIAESLLAGGLTIMEITLRTAEGGAARDASVRDHPSPQI